MTRLRSLVALTAVFASACATAISGSAESITRLEAARSANPGSEEAVRNVGIAYFKAGRYTEARTALQQAVSMNATDGVAALYLGLTAEAQNDLPAARKAYTSYLAVGKTRGVKNQINDRLALLARKENEEAAKRAIAQENSLSSTPGSPRTVAVLPFTFSGADTSLKPLERGFADLVTTDLTRASALTVVERERLQALLDEMHVQQTGVAAGTGVRAGKILQAGRLVGGSISQLGQNQLTANAYVTNVQTSQNVGNGARDQQTVDQLFTLEKNIVFGLFDDLGVTLTTAERNAIEQRPTRSLQAFLAYSRGLELEDQGRFDEAARFFDNAVRTDPGFGAAQQKSQEARNIAAGANVNASSVESGLRGTAEGAAVSSAVSGTTTAGGAMGIADGLNPSIAAGATSGQGSTSTQPLKDPSSATSADNPTTKTAKVTIVIKQP
jgi:tetratricopeptide (TPR) repeat protein